MFRENLLQTCQLKASTRRDQYPNKGRDHGLAIEFTNVSEDISNHILVDGYALQKELAISNAL